MPSVSWAPVSCPAGSTRIRTTAVLTAASLSAREWTVMTDDHGADRRRLARDRAAAAAAGRRGLRPVSRATGGYQPRGPRPVARRGRPVRITRAWRRRVPAGGQGAHGARQRPSLRRRGHRRQRRGGRAGVDQGPVAAAPPTTPGARRAAAGRADGRGDRAPTFTSRIAQAAEAVEAALAELDAAVLDGLAISVVTVRAGYVAGEETAAVRVLNGGPAKPTDKPPRPFEEGVGGPADSGEQCRDAGQPAVPAAARRGGIPPVRGLRRRRARSSRRSPGPARPPALYEIPHGVAFTDLLDPARRARRSGARCADGGLLRRPGQPATCSTPRSITRRLRRLNSGLGCGAVAILTDDCPVAVAASVMAYYDRENAGQCGSCFNGTAAMSAVTEALRDGLATDEDLARLERWSVVLRGRGACATLDARHQRGGQPARAVPPARRPSPRRTAARHAQSGAFSAVRPYEVEAVMTAMRIKLDRTMCDGFGICAKHAPEYFSLDDWGYASLDGKRHDPRPRPRRRHARAAGLPGARDHRNGRAPASRCSGPAHHARSRPSLT